MFHVVSGGFYFFIQKSKLITHQLVFSPLFCFSSPHSYKDVIYHIVRELTAAGDGTARIADIVERCATKGYTPAQVV